MTDKPRMALRIRHAFALEGRIHAVTECGRLWVRSTRAGTVRWDELDPPTVALPNWHWPSGDREDVPAKIGAHLSRRDHDARR